MSALYCTIGTQSLVLCSSTLTVDGRFSLLVFIVWKLIIVFIVKKNLLIDIFLRVIS